MRRRQRPYRSSHPLAIPRTALAFDVIRAYDALDDSERVVARQATPEAVRAFHTADYVAALLTAERDGVVRPADRARHNIGNAENPWFEDFYSIPATATGGSLMAAEAVLAGRAAFNPAGGMHHARADSAHGFCYLNDLVLAIMTLRRDGRRVLYLDIDAHHGDGVEAAFDDDPGVLTISLHMDTRYAYPFGAGSLDDTGSATAGHTTINVPLPAGTGDDEYRLLFDALFPAACRRFRPDVVVLQAGADSIAHDPLGRLALSTQGYLAIVQQVIDAAPRHADGTPCIMITGGGGYHPFLVARAWTGVWGLLSRRSLPEALPAQAVAALRDSGWDRDAARPWFANLLRSRIDEPEPRPVRDEVRRLADRVVRHPLLDGRA